MRSLLFWLRTARNASASFEGDSVLAEACMSKVGLPERVADKFDLPVHGRRIGSPLSSLPSAELRLPFIT